MPPNRLHATERESVPLRAAIYCRVSTAVQVDGTSLATQEDGCRGYAGDRGWEVLPPYVDRGMSGAREDRPGLLAMQADAAAGRFDVLVVYRLDRLGRSTSHTLRMAEELERLNVAFVSTTETLDTTSSGRLTLVILAAIAENESENIRARSKAGARRRVEQGGFVSSVPPFGYRSVPETRPGLRGVILDIDPHARLCILEMYRLLIEERLPMGEVVAALNAAGHTSAKARRWTQSALSTWARGKQPLTSAAGTWRWNDLQVNIPPILSRSQVRAWESWQADTTLPQKSRGPYLLSGFLYTPCGNGGRRYHGRSVSDQVPTYSCRHALTVRNLDADHCGCRNIRVHAADAAVWDSVVGMLRSREAMGIIAAQVADIAGTADLEQELKEAMESRDAIGAALASEYNSLIADDYPEDLAREMIRPRKLKLVAAGVLVKRLEGRITSTQRSSVGGNLLAVTMKAVAGRLDALDDDGKRNVMRALEVRAQVKEYVPCSRCAATGYVARPVRERHGWRDVCPACLRMRWVPVIEVHINSPAAFFAIPEGGVK